VTLRKQKLKMKTASAVSLRVGGRVFTNVEDGSGSSLAGSKAAARHATRIPCQMVHLCIDGIDRMPESAGVVFREHCNSWFFGALRSGTGQLRPRDS
jgi:hypothetical protein